MKIKIAKTAEQASQLTTLGEWLLQNSENVHRLVLLINLKSQADHRSLTPAKKI